MTEEELGHGPDEHDAGRAAALWGVPLTSIHCSHCGEDHLVPSVAIPLRCPLCHQGTLAPQTAYLRGEGPEQVLPFSIAEEKASTILDAWARGIWFRPAELNAKALSGRLRRYWIPLWLVDADVEGEWRADVGFDYEVVSYQDRYADGSGWRSEEVKESRVRWEPRAGRLDRRYQNIIAPALDDHRELMDHMGGYDLAARISYEPRAIERAAVRVPSLSPETAWSQAEPAIVRAAGDDCMRASGADHVRDFVLRARYENQNWTHLLLPAYSTWYEEGGQVWPVLVNGQSGRVYGARRASARKANTTSLVIGGVALSLFVLGALAALLGLAVPPIIVVGGVLLIVGVALALVAPIPAIAAWVHNRRSWPNGAPP